MKTKSLRTGSFKSKTSRPSFTELDPIFNGDDNHEKNTEGSDIKARHTGKDTNSMVSKDHSPSIPTTSIHYTNSEKPNIPKYETNNSAKNITSSSKQYSSEFPDSNPITAQSKNNFFVNSLNNKAPGPEPEFSNTTRDAIISKNNMTYDSKPDPKSFKENSNINTGDFNQNSMKSDYLSTTGDYGRGNFKESSDANKGYKDQLDSSKTVNAQHAGNDLSSNASMDVNSNSFSMNSLTKDVSFGDTKSIGNKATDRGESLKSEFSAKTSDRIMMPVNRGILSKQNVIFGYFKI